MAKENHDPVVDDELEHAEVPADGALAESEQAETRLEQGANEGEPVVENIDTLARELEQARAQVAEQHEALLRSRADLENLRKRGQRELENAHKYGTERLVNELLPIRDSMELGLAASEESNVNADKVHEGIELTLKMLNGALEKFGVSEVNPLGEAFNPELHQAMSMQDDDEAESGTVLLVVQKGYRMHDRLVRPAMVVVAK